jgi:AAA domain/Bifunctional DNA primase/polymerase, N-terminal
MSDIHEQVSCGNPLQIALAYISRGWTPVPIPFRQKKPVIDDWPNLRIDASNAHQYFDGEKQNIGLQLGEASHNLTDCDLDSREALVIAPYFLPKTPAMFGRASKRFSHWFFYTDLATRLQKAAVVFDDPNKAADVLAAGHSERLLEVRIGGKAAQTVAPGSVHRDTGELIRWEDGCDDEPARIGGERLMQAAHTIAAACLVARYWPAVGARHNAALTLGGFLARCLGMDVAHVELFAEAVARAVPPGPDGTTVSETIRCAGDSAKSFAKGVNVYGYPQMAEIFGEKVTRKVAEWLEFRGSRRDEAPPGGDADETRPFVRKFKNLASFIREYKPISYTIDGVLPSGVFYFLTARRSTGKTAFLIAALFAIILGDKNILGVKVKKGRVAYIALENPTDLRMKLEVARFALVPAGVGLDELADLVTIIDGRLPFDEVIEQLGVAIEEFGAFQAIFWDTFQAGFRGDEFNDNAGILKYAVQLRTLCELPGGPSLLVAAHPTRRGRADPLWRWEQHQRSGRKFDLMGRGRPDQAALEPCARAGIRAALFSDRETVEPGHQG